MSHYTDYFAWLEHGAWIRVCVRAIIFNRAGDRLLVEQNRGNHNEWANFIGGGLEIGETLQRCIERELEEESNARIARIDYRFAVENFLAHQGETRHSLEHYFEIELDREDLVPTNPDTDFSWIPLAGLATADLRPAVVRDCIADGTFRTRRTLTLNDPAAKDGPS